MIPVEAEVPDRGQFSVEPNNRPTNEERIVGAELWHHAARWRPEPEEALFALQAQFVAETYDLPALVRECLESARGAVRITEAAGDQYGLLDMYRDELAMLENVASGPLPNDALGQIELVRKLHRNSGEGVGNILDVTGISECRDVHVAEQLTEKEVVRLVGSTRPTLTQARDAIYTINEELGRGECVCFAIYEGGESGQPVGWYFVGNTID
jgi:hypothetical protein